MNADQATEFAATVRRHIGDQTLMFLGAHKFEVSLSKGVAHLIFVARGTKLKSWHHVFIGIENDEYTILVGKYVKFEFVEKTKLTGIGCEQLAETLKRIFG